MSQQDVARDAANTIADRLASPADARALDLANGWVPQSLAYGAVGVALLHIERARTGIASWQHAREWLACAATEPAVGGDESHLYYGVPALAFTLHAASDRQGRHTRALDTLDGHIATLTRRRVDRAHTRMDRGDPPALAEFDIMRGLTGIGAYLLRRDPHGALIRDVLAYLVRLTDPVKDDGDMLPGWWSDLAPSGRPSPDYEGGHANNGMAHGIAGPLALLSLAARCGVTVDGHTEAIGRICAWLDHWRQDSEAGPWWPYWITRAQLREEQQLPSRPSRPSWCYGTAGLARAQQLAALATNDIERQRMAEDALAGAMTDPVQLSLITDLSLCHGFAGLAHITRCAAADATTPALTDCLPRLLAPLTDTAPDALAMGLLKPPNAPGDIGLLDGAAGVALALHSAQTCTPPVSGWDACFLIN